MDWPYRIIVIVQAASKDEAEAAARAINSTGCDYEGDAFTTPLSADGSQPPTHYGLYTSATDSMIATMAEALPALPGVMFWRHGKDGTLQASNVTEPIGQPWGWGESLAAAGLIDAMTPRDADAGV